LHDEKEGFDAAVEIFGAVLGICLAHPAELPYTEIELDEHRNVIMTLIHRALPNVRGVRPRRVTKEHFCSERVLYHLIEKRVNAKNVKLRRFGKVRCKIITFPGGIPEFNEMVTHSKDNKFASKRVGTSARSFIFDRQKTIGGVGEGGDIKIVFSMQAFTVGGKVRNGERIEQGRIRISFVYSCDGIEEKRDTLEEQLAREEDIKRQNDEDDALLAKFLD